MQALHVRTMALRDHATKHECKPCQAGRLPFQHCYFAGVDHNKKEQGKRPQMRDHGTRCKIPLLLAQTICASRMAQPRALKDLSHGMWDS